MITKNYDAITLRRNYDTKLPGEIITGNYELVYYVAENVGIIGILAYPKIHSFIHGDYNKIYAEKKIYL